MHFFEAQLTWTHSYLVSHLSSSSPLTRLSLRPLSFLVTLTTPIAAAIDGRLDQLVHVCVPSRSPTNVTSVHADSTATTREEHVVDLQPGLPPAALPFALSHQHPAPMEAAVDERILVGTVWDRHMKDELALSGITSEQCLQAFYNASSHCFLALSSSPPSPATSFSPLAHSSRSALTFVSRVRSTLRSAWHPDLLPVAISFHQLASRHLQHHSLLFPPPSPFPFFLSDSFREHYLALHAATIRAVYEQQLSAVCPAVYHSLERSYASPAPSASLHALQERLSNSPALSPLIPHLSHALHRIHHQQMTDSLVNAQPSTAVVPSAASSTVHLSLSGRLWSTVDTALVRWRQAVLRGCVALHECVRVMEEDSARREMREQHDDCLELGHDDELLLIAHDDSDDEDGAEVGKQLVVLPHRAALPDPPTSLSRQLQRHLLSSLEQLTAAPLTIPGRRSSPPSPDVPASSPALHYQLSHLHSCLASLHRHLLHYLLSSSLLHYPSDLLSMVGESVLCVLSSEKKRVSELEYGGLVGKLYEVMRAFSETVAAVQCAH